MPQQKPSTSERVVLAQTAVRRDELTFDYDRAREVLCTLYDRFVASGASKTIERNAPQRMYRPQGTLLDPNAYARWLYFAGATDAREESASVYAAHRALYDQTTPRFDFGHSRRTRELYEPAVLDWNHENFVHALAKTRIGNPKRSIIWWPVRAKTLFETWEGNPFAMFEGRTIDDVMHWKESEKGRLGYDPIPGIGPKIASLIAIFLEDVGMPPVVDAFPVDVWVQSEMLSLGIVTSTRPGPIANDTLEELIRPALSKLCEEKGWSRIYLSHALWLYGNGNCRRCVESPQMRDTCPVWGDCMGKYRSGPYFRLGYWLTHEAMQPKGGSVVCVYPVMPLFA